MRKIVFGMCAVILTALMACNRGGENARWQAEIDSLKNVNEQQRQVLDDMTGTLVEVASSLDSIAVAEGMLRESNEGPVLTKRQMLENLATFKETLAANKERMAELERLLAGRSDEFAKLGNIVKHLNEEIAAKEVRINQLEEELRNANTNIERMRGEMNEMTNTIGSQQNELNIQREAMQNQEAALHTAYYVIGSKSDLKNKGLVTGGGLFKKQKVNYDSIDKNLFVKIDTRTTTRFEIPSKKVTVMTEMPEGSYTLQTTGNKSVLTITNVNRFWSVTNFLIIQID